MTGAEYAKMRREMEVTQRELAKSLGISWTTVSKRERGIRVVKKEASCAITWLWFLDGQVRKIAARLDSEEPPPPT